MTSDPPDPIAAAAARYKRDNDKALASRKELTSLVLDALREPDAKPIDIAKRAEWTPAYVRKLARDNDIQADADYKARTEKARARLIAEASQDSAVATPRVRVSAVAPPEPSPEAEPTESGAEATVTVPLPEMSSREIHKAIKRAMSHATPDQRERLNRTAKVSEQLGRDAQGEVLKAAFEMGLLTHDEVYAEPTTTDEAAASERPVSGEEKTP